MIAVVAVAVAIGLVLGASFAATWWALAQFGASIAQPSEAQVLACIWMGVPFTIALFACIWAFEEWRDR